MANAYRLIVGKHVHYYTAGGKRRIAKIISVVSQTSAVIATVTNTGTRTSLNSGTAVPKRTAHGQTNVWRPY